MFFRQALQAGLTHASSLDQRRVGLDDDVTLLQPPSDVLPRAPGVDLVLTDGDLAADSAVDVRLQLLQVVDSIVGDTDGTDLAGLLGLDQSAPGTQTAFLPSVGGVEQDPVQVSLCRRIIPEVQLTDQCNQGPQHL